MHTYEMKFTNVLWLLRDKTLLIFSLQTVEKAMKQQQAKAKNGSLLCDSK
jgi:hypothetical protein